MPVFLAAVALAPFAYSFGPNTKVDYDVNVQFEGFLPVLGGNEGVVDVKMGVKVTGAKAEPGMLKAASEITSFDLTFNGSKLPLTLSNVTDYFPKTNVGLTPQGKILSNDAPDRKLPVRLPGLDVKRFPDITYIPLEFPTEGFEVGESWTFVRTFGDSPLTYTCTPVALTDNGAEIKVEVKQEYTVLENEALEVVVNREDAVSEVTTKMTGSGTVVLDLANGVARSAEMRNTAVSTAKNLSSGENKERKLVTTFKVALKGQLAASGGKAPKASNPGDLWTRAGMMGRDAWTWLQLAAMFGMKALPSHIQAWIAPFREDIRRSFPWLLGR
ncbi:MAG: hypothetical protein KIT11_03285 [Fimbriimonadaceae bacterium]|nr:hypothetical protein [Fimbriimonadaceae bacterium]QYK57079.1 MAG: hypothetical protein KF733_06240 [Fimbriimonadaceae bacterium]